MPKEWHSSHLVPSPGLIARVLIYIEAPRISVIAELDSPEELTAFSIHILLIEFIRWLRSVGGSS